MKSLLPIQALLALVLTLVCFPPKAEASTIFWGSFSNDILLDSAGNSLDGSYRFEVGTFVTGFTPTVANIQLWEANWMVFDAAVDGDGWSPLDQFVNTSADHTASAGSSSPDADPADVFAQGVLAYLWVFNSKDLGVAGTEWALLANYDTGTDAFPGAWEFPDPNLPPGDSFDWQTRDLDAAIFGGVNNTQGPGAHTPPPGAFTIQTHVVPEPGSLVLLGAAFAFTARRSRRSQARELLLQTDRSANGSP